MVEECERIIKSAKFRNPLLSLTGYLIYKGGYFIQVLEGPIVNIDLLYGRISLDTRHGELRRLHRGPIQQRNFSNWSKVVID